MRHKKAHRKFGRTSSHRRAMFRNMVTSFLNYERIETTVAKAKDLRPIAEKLITVAGVDNLHNRRKAYSYLQSKKVVHKLFAEIGPKFKERPGGYCRIIRTRTRAGDAAEMAVIELVEDYKPKAKKKKAKPAKEAAPKKKAEPKKEAKAEKVEEEKAPEVEATAEVEAELKE